VKQKKQLWVANMISDSYIQGKRQALKKKQAPVKAKSRMLLSDADYLASTYGLADWEKNLLTTKSILEGTASPMSAGQSVATSLSSYGEEVSATDKKIKGIRANTMRLQREAGSKTAGRKRARQTGRLQPLLTAGRSVR
jgi:hypothetical protein